MIFHKQNSRLQLEIQEQSYTFSTPHDFEFALQGRTDVSSCRARRYLGIAPEELRNEAVSMREVEQCFARALEESGRGETDIAGFLGGLDLAVISKDHEWREIIRALNHASDAPDSYKKVALVKYMQYLAARQEMLMAIYADHDRGAPPNGAVTDEHDPALGETSMFSAAQMQSASGVRRQHRIPKGETVEIMLDSTERVELLLAKSRCAIILRDTPVFVDPNGDEHPLRPGRNLIGRDAAAEIRIDANLRDVSRKHLLIESDGECTVRVLDISSHGTSIDDRYLDNTSI